MVNGRTAAVAVTLALLASVQNAVCQITGNCDPSGSTRCYWEHAHKYGVKVLIPVPGNKPEYLSNVCASESEMPAEPRCKSHYEGCSESEKLKFAQPEEGYRQLQAAVTDAKKCKGVSNLTMCIDKVVLMNCTVHFSMIPTTSNADRNHRSAVNLTECLEESLKSCDPTQLPNCMKHIRSIANALPLLYWHEEQGTTTVPVTTELPSSTSVSTETAPETSPTTEKSVPTSEQTTEPPHPSETTTAKPETTTNQPSSSEPATTSPTETSPTGTTTPATTPKPSGAATSTPFVGTLVFLSAVWMARVA